MEWGDIVKTEADMKAAFDLLRAELPVAEYSDDRLREEVVELRRYKLPLYRPYTLDQMARRDWG